jgi:predicted xylose isomerase-like sugar epimerase
VSTVDSYAGRFELATRVEAHRAGTLVHVTVSAVDHARLVLDFSDHEVLTNASVLLCGTIGARELLDRGYTGPLATRPRLAASARSKASR